MPAEIDESKQGFRKDMFKDKGHRMLRSRYGRPTQPSNLDRNQTSEEVNTHDNPRVFCTIDIHLEAGVRPTCAVPVHEISLIPERFLPTKLSTHEFDGNGLGVQQIRSYRRCKKDATQMSIHTALCFGEQEEMCLRRPVAYLRR